MLYRTIASSSCSRASSNRSSSSAVRIGIAANWMSLYKRVFGVAPST
jgi:hypothetical protein